ncbi:MAG: hypothetical protein WA174_00075 [Rhodoferax sp.]
MPSAPAVSVAVARSAWHLRAIGVLCVLAGLACGALARDLPPMQALLLAAVVLATGATALVGWYRSPAGCLQWDGLRWHWPDVSDTPDCRLILHFDFQRVMLVSLRGSARRTTWLWLESMPGDPHWMALRRAVVASRRLPAAGDSALSRPDGGCA